MTEDRPSYVPDAPLVPAWDEKPESSKDVALDSSRRLAGGWTRYRNPAETRLNKALWAAGRVAAHYRLLRRTSSDETMHQLRGELANAVRQANEWKVLLEAAKTSERILRETRVTEVEYLAIKKKLSEAIKDLLALAKDHEQLRSVVIGHGGIKVD